MAADSTKMGLGANSCGPGRESRHGGWRTRAQVHLLRVVWGPQQFAVHKVAQKNDLHFEMRRRGPDDEPVVGIAPVRFLPLPPACPHRGADIRLIRRMAFRVHAREIGQDARQEMVVLLPSASRHQDADGDAATEEYLQVDPGLGDLLRPSWLSRRRSFGTAPGSVGGGGGRPSKSAKPVRWRSRRGAPIRREKHKFPAPLTR